MKILYFAPLYYDDMKQRPQQIAECLAEKHEVYYVEPTVSFIRRLIKKGRPCTGYGRKISRHLTCIRLNGLFTFHKSIEILDLLGVNNLSEYVQIKKLAEYCDVIWAGYSGWYTLVRHIKGKPVVFDWMDEEELLVSSKLLKMTLIRNKRKILKLSDIVFTTCMKFYEQARNTKKTYLVPNAVSENFLMADDRCEKKPVSERKHRKIIFGYIGTIGEWFDFDAVRLILNLNPCHYIVLAGRNMQPVFKHARVSYLGIKPHEKLPEIIRKFDICLYNFRQDSLLDTINPVKIYEYLAAGKPVLAVSSRETRVFEKYVMLYKELDEIPKLLRDKWKQPFAAKEDHMRFVSENTWTARAGVIEDALLKLKSTG